MNVFAPERVQVPLPVLTTTFVGEIAAPPVRTPLTVPLPVPRKNMFRPPLV